MALLSRAAALHGSEQAIEVRTRTWMYIGPAVVLFTVGDRHPLQLALPMRARISECVNGLVNSARSIKRRPEAH
jgi:hypothetical protein